MARLTVRRHDGAHVEIGYRNGFIVDRPDCIRQRHHNAIVAMEPKLGLKQRVRRYVGEIAGPYCKRFALKPRVISTSDMQTGWGSCGLSGSILINWALVLASRRVLEYVVAHELMHLTVRTHGSEFWAHLAMMMPDYERSKGWLDTHQASLDVSFLDRPA